MSAKKLILFFVVLVQVAIMGVTVAVVAGGGGPEIFIYLEAGFVALVLSAGLIFLLSVSFGRLFFAFGGFVHLMLTLGVVGFTGYFAVTSSDDIMFIAFLAACSLVMIVSLIPILCGKK